MQSATYRAGERIVITNHYGGEIYIYIYTSINNNQSISCRAVMIIGKCIYSSTYFNTAIKQRWVVSFRRWPLYHGVYNVPRYTRKRRVGGSRSRPGFRGKEKTLCLCQESNNVLLAGSLVSITTELHHWYSILSIHISIVYSHQSSKTANQSHVDYLH
jgi:hypothetical protein